MELAHEFLDDAKHLLEGGSLRSAISRAYYAAYHACVWALEHEGFRPHMFRGRHGRPAWRWEHQIICEAFQNVLVENFGIMESHFATVMRELYTRRIIADYRLIPVHETEATEAVQLAATILGATERMVS